MYSNKLYKTKNSNWQETQQLSIYKLKKIGIILTDLMQMATD